MHWELTRRERAEDGVFGELRLDGRLVCLTLEQRNLDNRQFISCIPEGDYFCRRIHSLRFGECFQVCDVPGRTEILLHCGNTIKDTSGCILLGLSQGMVGNVRGVIHSRQAFSEFMQLLKGTDIFSLTIRSEWTA